MNIVPLVGYKCVQSERTLSERLKGRGGGMVQGSVRQLFELENRGDTAKLQRNIEVI
jgi:hypothetical protein